MHSQPCRDLRRRPGRISASSASAELAAGKAHDASVRRTRYVDDVGTPPPGPCTRMDGRAFVGMCHTEGPPAFAWRSWYRYAAWPPRSGPRPGACERRAGIEDPRSLHGSPRARVHLVARGISQHPGRQLDAPASRPHLFTGLAGVLTLHTSFSDHLYGWSRPEK